MNLSREEKVWRGLVSLVLILLLSSIASNVLVTGSPHRSDMLSSELKSEGIIVANTPHSPIAINGDANFLATAVAEGWAGDGSSDTPYVIENLDIDLGPTPEASINISHTRAHFIIRNCRLTGPAATPSYGIFLENVTNAQMVNNEGKDFAHGVYILGGSKDISLSLNNFSYNSYGIFIIDSISITVDDNTCCGNFFHGIQMVDSNSNLVTNNYCDGNLINGIYLYNASLNTVSGNTCNGNDDTGILLESSSDNNILEDNVCNTNGQVGIHLLGSSLNNLTRSVCAFNSFGIRLQDFGDNNTVVSNKCTNNTMLGMLLTYADYNSLIGNNCSSNNAQGVHMWRSHFNTIANGIYSSNGDNGIWNAGDSNHITNNICSRNGYGISFDPEADFGTAMWNVLEDNSNDNGVDLGANNDFNYNYWSDYAGADVDQDGIGDTAHAFDYNSDSNPLMYYPFPPELAQTPTDQVLEFGNVFEYTLEFIVTVTTAPYELAVNDSMNFAVDTGDRIISRTALAVGIYPLEIVATNIYGFTTEGGLMLTVQDTTPPTITPGNDITCTEGETDHELQWTLSDLSSLTYTLLRNGTEVTSDDTPRPSIYFSMTIGYLAPGVYNYTIVAVDSWDNVATDTVLVTVLPIPIIDVLLPWLSVGIVAVVALVVIVFLLRRRRTT